MSRHTNDPKKREDKAQEMPGSKPIGTDETPTPVEQSKVSEVSEELAAAQHEVNGLKAELADLNEKYLRKLADEVNFRKRMIREKEDAQKYGVSSLLADLIPILDDFDRGITSAEVTKSCEQLHEGVLLIRKQLSQMLENKYSLKRFESKDTPFDPNRHEALFAEPADVEEPMVSEEYLPGYSLHERILRTAKVRVKIPAPKPADGGASHDGNLESALDADNV
jgi:molecular chaperone GrpE